MPCRLYIVSSLFTYCVAEEILDVVPLIANSSMLVSSNAEVEIVRYPLPYSAATFLGNLIFFKCLLPLKA